MIEILKALLFGIVEGITEWLPISSTGHMILLNEFIKLNVSDDFKDMFLVVIQLGAILAVVILFWKKIFPFHLGEIRNKKKNVIDKPIFQMWFKIVIACVPAAIVGVLWDDVLDRLFYNFLSVSIALIVFGIGFIVIERLNKNRDLKIRDLSEITYQTAALIGIFQLIAAVFPGTSRSGATIVGALLLGVTRTVAAEFTFFMAIPVMLGASLVKLIKLEQVPSSMELLILLVGMITAFGVSLLVIKLLMDYVKKHDFQVFGWYRIGLGAILIGYYLIAM